MSRSMGELLDQVTDRLICRRCGRVGELVGDREAKCAFHHRWYTGPERGTPIKMDTVDPDDDEPLPAMSCIARLEARIEGLEVMVKRIAAHLGIEG